MLRSMLQYQLFLWSNSATVGVDVDDRALVAALQERNAEAIQYVVGTHAPSLYRLAFYQLRDPALAEDLVSEVMVRMITKIHAFSPDQASFRTWLFRIARNLIADHYRANTRKPQVSLEQWLDSAPDKEPGRHDSELDLVLDRDQLHSALATLTDEQRDVVLLHVIEGWELPEVAELLGRSLASVKSLYYRGMQSLRRRLEAEPQIT